MENLFPTIRKSKDPIVIYPNPPSWIRMRITICPNKEKSLGVSLTISPVTHILEVAVKRLSARPILSPDEEMGKERSKHPIKIIQR